MKKHKSKVLLSFLIITMLISIVACSSTSKSSNYVKNDYTEGFVSDSENGIDRSPIKNQAMGGKDNQGFNADEQKISHKYYYDIETLSYDKNMDAIKENISKFSAHIVDLEARSIDNAYHNRKLHHANMTIKVPKDKTGGFLVAIEAIEANIISQSQSSDDYTDSYNDADMKSASLQKRLMALMKLYETAENMEDIITIQRHIMDVEDEIERLENVKLQIDKKVDFTTVVIDLREVADATELQKTEEPFKNQINDSFRTSLIRLQRLGKDFVLFIVSSWYIIIIFALAIIALITISKKNKKNKKIPVVLKRLEDKQDNADKTDSEESQENRKP